MSVLKRCLSFNDPNVFFTGKKFGGRMPRATSGRVALLVYSFASMYLWILFKGEITKMFTNIAGSMIPKLYH